MEDQLITFPTAKLAKEKGFTKSGYPVYSFDGLLIKEYTNANNIYPAPTQSLLQRWLREKHKIHIVVAPLKQSGKNSIVFNVEIFPESKICGFEFYGFKTYEKALEAGFQDALNLIQ